jgi:serine kinase of HPr protein (carbohydrate metabolism regulator)
MSAKPAGSTTQTAGTPSLTIHASAVAIGETGVVIRGPSGCGKSSLVMDLVFATERMGRFASLVGDDRIDLDNRGGRLIARGHRLVLGMVEKRGLGILNVPHERAVVVGLVVDIVAPQEAVRFPDPEHNHVVLCGVQVPVLALLRGQAPYDCAVSVLAYLERAGVM